jgi:hypothetical protein
MTCALCKREEPLVNSHIVPEFLYRPHYDEKHRTLLFDKRNAPSTMLQKGLREELLCVDCEGRLQVFETYFARFWYKQGALPDVVQGPEVVLTGIDYSRFKLFVLSIAWRASVSTLAPHTSLGPHEEPIRLMLLDAKPGPMHWYPIFAGVIVDGDTGKPWDGVILGPTKMRVTSHWACRMVFAAVSWTVLTSRHQTLPLEDYFLTEGGQLRLRALPLRDFALGSGLTEA